MNTNEKNIPSIYMYHQTEKSQKRKKKTVYNLMQNLRYEKKNQYNLS